MTRTQAWTVHGSNLLVGGTGLVYAWMRYFAESDDPYSVVNHPWQPTFQHAHVLVAPLLVFGVGMLWGNHIWRRYKLGAPSHRKSGIVLGLLFFPMMVSGYALQVSVEDTWRQVWVWVHVATSLLWIIPALVHPLLQRPQAGAAAKTLGSAHAPAD